MRMSDWCSDVCSSDLFFDQKNLRRACIAGRVANGAALDRCGARWHADHDFGPAWEAAVSMHLVNEVLDHLLGNIDVRDHAVAQGPNRLDRKSVVQGKSV